MLSWLLFTIVGVATAQSITYKLEKPTGASMNGSGWQISRVVIIDESKDKKEQKMTVCGEKVDNATLLVFCSMRGYMAHEQLFPDKGMTWKEGELSVGYSARCTKWDSLDSCTITNNTDCKQPLIINCTTHYEVVLGGGVSTNDLLLPVILIPVCLLYVIVLCYLESEDTRKSEAARKHMLKADTVKAFQSSAKPSKSEGTV